MQKETKRNQDSILFLNENCPSYDGWLGDNHYFNIAKDNYFNKLKESHPELIIKRSKSGLSNAEYINVSHVDGREFEIRLASHGHYHFKKIKVADINCNLKSWKQIRNILNYLISNFLEDKNVERTYKTVQVGKYFY